MIQAPKVDRRTASDLAKQVGGLLPKYVRGWPEHRHLTGASEALIRVFAKFGELIIERLNKAPEKNFLAFLDLLGVSPLPPQPARVPLTFYPMAQSTGSVVVPASTQVAAQPAKGEKEPVIFETERELVITSAKLESLLVKDGTQDQYADYGSILDRPPSPAQPIAASFTINSATRTSSQKVTVTATSSEGSPAAGETPSKVSISALSLSATTVRGGEALSGTVTLSASAPPTGLLVFLQINDNSCAIPNSLVVAAGQSSATFTIKTSEWPGVPAFQGNTPIPHVLYIGLKTPSPCPALKQLRLSFLLDQNIPTPPDQRSLQWGIVDGRIPLPAGLSTQPVDEVFKVIPLTSSQDATENLTKSGDVVFADLPPFRDVAVGGSTNRWLTCRMLTPIVRGTERKAGTVRESQLPSVRSVAVHSEIERRGLGIEQAFVNSTPVDLTKDFFPFGEKPKFGDTLYLSSREAFSIPNAVVTIHIKLTNPAPGGVELPIAATKPQGTKLRWEFWDGEMWAELGTSEFGRLVRILKEATEFSDTTKTFSESGDVSFKFPKSPQPTTVNGQGNFWVRVRIVGGDYGKEAHYVRDTAKGYVVEPSTLAPPSVSSTQVDYVLSSEAPADALLTYNDFAYARALPDGEPFKPFKPVDEAQPSLYLGFTLPPGQAFSDRSMSLYFGVSNTPGNQRANSSASELTAVTWEYWNGSRRAWTKWTVRDDTSGFRHAGLIRFLAPADFSSRKEFGRQCHWLRALKSGEAADFEPRLNRVLLNTTMAIQALTSTNEVLGSSNGTPGQIFRVNRAPVLEGQQLEVLEPTMPHPEEQELVRNEEGEDAISQSVNPASHREEIWLRWHEVPNFYGSGPRDRHYVLNRLTGELKFGDGLNGLVPPVLPGNIRMARYRTGGGTIGNKSPGSIMQLRTTVPYVEKVTNIEAGSGGADAETDAALLERAPRGLRHGRRAVTAEDFEDLALLASPGVARAKCIALYDLAVDAGAERRRPGVISLIIVPRSTDLKPLPSLELFDRVRSFLDGHRLLAADLVLVGPEYVRIHVETEIAVDDPDTATDVELAVTLALSRFLHPLTGLEGAGWDFGRRPAKSDLYALIEGVPGVSHVRELKIAEIPDRPGTETTGHFLIYSSDQHKVIMTLEE